jgi:general secretion pathway protein I
MPRIVSIVLELDGTTAWPRLDAPLRAGSSEGRFDDQYRWRLVVTPWTPPMQPQAQAAMPVPGAVNAPMRMVKLDLDVYWGARARERSAHFSTLRLLAPAAAGTP